MSTFARIGWLILAMLLSACVTPDDFSQSEDKDLPAEVDQSQDKDGATDLETSEIDEPDSDIDQVEVDLDVEDADEHDEITPTCECPNGFPCLQRDGCLCPTASTECTLDDETVVCVNADSDPYHCGQCDNPCGQNTACIEGSCCLDGQVNCNGKCTDLMTTRDHCGGCGIECEEGTECITGICCPASQICDGQCVDLNISPQHCGECGNACDESSLCQAGVCSCNSPLMMCDERCVDPQSDSDHCGGCEAACPGELLCIEGECGCGDLLECNNECVDPTTDLHCGSCDNSCVGAQFCEDGACACPYDFLTACDDICVDTSIDVAHCGDCTTHCLQGTERCSDGKCCLTSQTNCSGSCVDTANDASNCGACGNNCTSGLVCREGSCQCPNHWETYCPGEGCINLATSHEHCGQCYNECGTGSSCCFGACTAECENYPCLSGEPASGQICCSQEESFNIPQTTATSCFGDSCFNGTGTPGHCQFDVATCETQCIVP